ncbi:MAG: hypothetical protein V4477_01730 [Pseudomonadota bacterium]
MTLIKNKASAILAQVSMTGRLAQTIPIRVPMAVNASVRSLSSIGMAHPGPTTNLAIERCQPGIPCPSRGGSAAAPVDIGQARERIPTGINRHFWHL